MQADAFLRCLQLASPALPIGAYAYSQGLETAVELGWVHDASSLHGWLDDQVEQTLARVDLPVLGRLHAATIAADLDSLAHWSTVLLAQRETRELRADDVDRGRALARLLRDLEVPLPVLDALAAPPLALPFAIAAAAWHIDVEHCAQAYAFAWLEGQVSAGVKLVPLGQVAGQRLLIALAPALGAAVAAGLACDDDDIGGALPALAIASSRHEFQYTRLFRS